MANMNPEIKYHTTNFKGIWIVLILIKKLIFTQIVIHK